MRNLIACLMLSMCLAMAVGCVAPDGSGTQEQSVEAAAESVRANDGAAPDIKSMASFVGDPTPDLPRGGSNCGCDGEYLCCEYSNPYDGTPYTQCEWDGMCNCLSQQWCFFETQPHGWSCTCYYGSGSQPSH